MKIWRTSMENKISNEPNNYYKKNNRKIIS